MKPGKRFNILDQFMGSDDKNPEQNTQKESTPKLDNDPYSEGVDMDLFNKANGPNKKELYKAIIIEALKILLLKNKDFESFKDKMQNGGNSFKTKAALALILESLIKCIGKYEVYFQKDWDINQAYKKLRKTFQNLDNMSTSDQDFLKMTKAQIRKNEQLTFKQHQALNESFAIDFNNGMNMSGIASMENHMIEIGMDLNMIEETHDSGFLPDLEDKDSVKNYFSNSVLEQQSSFHLTTKNENSEPSKKSNSMYQPQNPDQKLEKEKYFSQFQRDKKHLDGQDQDYNNLNPQQQYTNKNINMQKTQKMDFQQNQATSSHEEEKQNEEDMIAKKMEEAIAKAILE